MNPVAMIPTTILGLTLALPAASAPLSRTAPASQPTARSPQAPTQEPKEGLSDLVKRFEKAYLLETVERDPKTAGEMYAALIQSRGGSPSFYAKCWLRMGVCLDALGMKDKAKGAYTKAMNLSPLIAAEAKARLQGQDPRRFDHRVRNQINKLLANRDVDTAKRDLLWIGTDCVPLLIKEIEAEKLNLDFVVRATDILLALGGPETIAFIKATSKSEDTLLRRALVRGFTSKVGPDLAKAMAIYLDDPDARTREETLRRIINIVPTSTILDFLDKGPHKLRDYLLSRFREAPGGTGPVPSRSGSWYWNYDEDKDGKNADRLLALYRRWFGEDSTDSPRKKTNLMRDWVLWKALLERSRGWDTLALMVRKADDPISFQLPHYLRWDEDNAPTPPQLAELAEALPPYPRVREQGRPSANHLGPDWLMQQLQTMIMRAKNPPLLKADFVDVIPRLAARNYDHSGVLSQAIRALAGPEDLGMVVGLIPQLYSTHHLTWISKQKPTLDLLPTYKKSLAYIWEQRKTKGNRFTADWLPWMLYKSLISLEDPAIATFVTREAGTHPEIYEGVAQGLLAWKTPPMDSLARLLVTPSQGSEVSRGKVFLYLARAGANSMGANFGRADALGLSLALRSKGRQSRSARSCLEWLLAVDRDAKPGPYLHTYSPEQLGKIVEECLATGNSRSWQGIYNVVSRGLPNYAGGGGWMSSFKVAITDPILAGIIRALPKAPTSESRVDQLVRNLCSVPLETHPSLRVFYRWMLANENAGYRSMALRNMKLDDFPDLADKCLSALDSDGTGVQSTAIHRLGELGSRQAFDKVLPFLKSSDYSVRYAAIEALPKIDIKRGLVAVLPLMKDSSPNIRLKVIGVCRTSLEPGVTSTLLLGLQDGNGGVRKAAQEALDAIRFYHEQKSFWDAWNKRTKLGYANPATALLEQAQKDQPQKIRMQAIRALGTLGDAGSLPFLIQLMKDGNAQIEKAAEEALDRIHAKKD